MKKKLGLGLMLLFLVASISIGQSLYEELAASINIVVAADGSGNYISVMDAITAAPSGSVIFIKKGHYFEKVEMSSSKSGITIIGEDIDSTIIDYNDYSGSGELYNGIMTSRIGDPIGTSTSHTMYIDAADVTVLNLTVKNSAGDVGQAVALNVGDDRTIVARCRLLGNQDTYYTWGYGRFYFKDTYIEGGTDFIFGRGACLFDSCVINCNSTGNKLTAASTDQNWKFGYVFQNCKLTADANVGNSVYLGRPWKDWAQTVYMNCHLGDHIRAAGWEEWDGRSATCYYAEYKNIGPGSDTTARVSWSHQLTDLQASQYTMANIFAADVNSSPFSSNWNPDLEANTFYQAVKRHSYKLYDDSLFNIAYLEDLKYNDLSIEDFIPTKYGYNVILPVNDTTVPVITATAQDTLATINIADADEVPGRTTVSVTARNGFKINYNINFLNATSIETLKSELVHKVISPFSDELIFRLTNLNTGKVSISIYNITGKQILHRDFQWKDGKDIHINTTSLHSGIYFYNIEKNGITVGGKVIKN